MKITCRFEWNYINYLLLSVEHLLGEEDFCLPNNLITHCSLRVYNGQIIDYRSLIGRAFQLGFIDIKRKKITLSEKGAEFLSFNSERNFEITETQKEYILNNFYFQGLWKSITKRLISSFSPNYDKNTFQINSIIINELPPSLFSLLFILLEFNVLQKITVGIELYYQISPQYLSTAIEIRALNRINISQDDLDVLLEERRRLGFHAEELVVKYEKHRLINTNRTAEADRVIRISELDVAAGYDIKSFNGFGVQLIHDRFIEVKSTELNEFRFYWSKNEVEVAEELGNLYWIYFISNISIDTQYEDLDLIMIQNPYKEIFMEGDNFKIDVKEYLVTKPDQAK